MSAKFTPDLPEPIPLRDIRVDDERHRYKTFENKDGSTYEEREYTLEKAPIRTIEKVTGVVDGLSNEFEKGVDYELSADNNRIVWQPDPAERPDGDSFFYVTYRCKSIIGRYADAGADEMQQIEDYLLDVISHKFIDTAEGEELEELGKLFGVLGKRRGRNDFQYRSYLKSIVQSFISRGTTNGIKTAVAAATDVPLDDIEIRENFDTNSYEVVVIPDTAIRGSIIEEVAEIADPSGVEQILTRFTIDEKALGVDDAFTVRDDPDGSTADELSSSDSTTPREVSDGITADEMAADDATTSSQSAVALWDTDNWNGNDWTTEVN